MSEPPEQIDGDGRIALLGMPSNDKTLKLKEIITSPKSRNSDRLYIYEKVAATETAEKGE